MKRGRKRRREAGARTRLCSLGLGAESRQMVGGCSAGLQWRDEFRTRPNNAGGRLDSKLTGSRKERVRQRENQKDVGMFFPLSLRRSRAEAGK